MKKYTKLIYIIICVALAALIAYRVSVIVREAHRQVFNIVRNDESSGTPVNTMVVQTRDEILYEPLTIKNGAANVTGARVKKFRVGQKIKSGGHIIAVGNHLDLDTGMFVIKASSPDGMQYAEIDMRGIFVPNSAINNDRKIMVANGDTASARAVSVVANDADNSVVTGLNDGDVIILSPVGDGEKIKIMAGDK